jgi:hypothetical protein
MGAIITAIRPGLRRARAGPGASPSRFFRARKYKPFRVILSLELIFKNAQPPGSPRNAPATKYNGGVTMRRHSHKFTIADDEAVLALVEKLLGGQGPSQARREKLLRAPDDASRHYKDSKQKVRRAFFHGLFTGYAVALKLC